MSVLTVLAVIGIIVYVIGQQLAGSALSGKRLVVLPAVLTVIGIADIGGHGSHPGATDIVLLVVSAAIAIAIGVGLGAMTRLERRDGHLWAQLPQQGLWLWGGLIVSRLLVIGIAHAAGAPIAAGTAAILLMLGLNRAAQALVVVTRAVAAGIPRHRRPGPSRISPEGDQTRSSVGRPASDHVHDRLRPARLAVFRAADGRRELSVRARRRSCFRRQLTLGPDAGRGADLVHHHDQRRFHVPGGRRPLRDEGSRQGWPHPHDRLGDKACRPDPACPLQERAIGFAQIQQRRRAQSLSQEAAAGGMSNETPASERFQQSGRLSPPAVTTLLLPFQTRSCAAQPRDDRIAGRMGKSRGGDETAGPRPSREPGRSPRPLPLAEAK